MQEQEPRIIDMGIFCVAQIFSDILGYVISSVILLSIILEQERFYPSIFIGFIFYFLCITINKMIPFLSATARRLKQNTLLPFWFNVSLLWTNKAIFILAIFYHLLIALSLFMGLPLFIKNIKKDYGYLSRTQTQMDECQSFEPNGEEFVLSDSSGYSIHLVRVTGRLSEKNDSDSNIQDFEGFTCWTTRTNVLTSFEKDFFSVGIETRGSEGIVLNGSKDSAMVLPPFWDCFDLNNYWFLEATGDCYLVSYLSKSDFSFYMAETNETKEQLLEAFAENNFHVLTTDDYFSDYPYISLKSPFFTLVDEPNYPYTAEIKLFLLIAPLGLHWIIQAISLLLSGILNEQILAAKGMDQERRLSFSVRRARIAAMTISCFLWLSSLTMALIKGHNIMIFPLVACYNCFLCCYIINNRSWKSPFHSNWAKIFKYFNRRFGSEKSKRLTFKRSLRMIAILALMLLTLVSFIPGFLLYASARMFLRSDAFQSFPLKVELLDTTLLQNEEKKNIAFFFSRVSEYLGSINSCLVSIFSLSFFGFDPWVCIHLILSLVHSLFIFPLIRTAFLTRKFKRVGAQRSLLLFPKSMVIVFAVRLDNSRDPINPGPQSNYTQEDNFQFFGIPGTVEDENGDALEIEERQQMAVFSENNELRDSPLSPLDLSRIFRTASQKLMRQDIQNNIRQAVPSNRINGSNDSLLSLGQSALMNFSSSQEEHMTTENEQTGSQGPNLDNISIEIPSNFSDTS